MNAAECLDRIAARDPIVQAWEVVDWSARGREGLPVGIKDLIDTADFPTTYGSAHYRGHRPARDAACVAALRKAGAVILGKTVTTEFAVFNPGKTRNPRDPARTPGGSSSGSAAAVADGMVPAALGTQTAASIIRPAAYCGCIGWKPTFGTFAMEGIHPISPSLDTLGFFVQSLDLVAPLYRMLAGVELPEARATRFAFCKTEAWGGAESSTQRAFQNYYGRYVEVQLAPGLVDAQIAIMGAEGAVALRNAPEPSAKLRAFLDAGRAVMPDQLRQARERAEQGRREIERVFEKFDAVITPATTGEAPVGLDSTGDPLFSRIWTLLGNPCVSLPLLKGAAGLPLGVQVIGPRGRDEVLLAAARSLMS
ncbi:MAG: amidase [Myxococcales bacterium]|nr:amidase [Myxococcales bacterium]